MQVKASLKNLRISPRKVRLLANLVKGMNVNEAKTQLKFSNKKSSEPLLKLLESAIANAQNNFKLKNDNLYISKLLVNSCPMLKRWKPRAMGRASAIRKRVSSVIMELSEKINEQKENNTKKYQKNLAEVAGVAQKNTGEHIVKKEEIKTKNLRKDQNDVKANQNKIY